jgi:T-complex protein 1 subunit beta
MRMAYEVEQLASSVNGKESLAIEAFARALRQLPTIIADNAGLDSAELVSNLRSSIFNGSQTAGVNVIDGTVGDMKEMGIYECLKVKEQALISACEAAEMILRVDEIVTCAPRQRDRE